MNYVFNMATLFVVFTTSAMSPTILAKPIVVSGSQLEVGALSSEKRFDETTITITGPDGFERKMKVYGKNTEIDLEELGIERDGNYSYQIEYAHQGDVEIVNDPKNGRSGALRNLGRVETKSGFFNVKDSEFVLEETEEYEN